MKNIFVALLVFTVVGCASNPQLNVPFEGNSLPANSTIGLAISSIPANTSRYPGASCLLCLAAASAANGGIAKHVKTLEHDTFGELQNTLKVGLEKMGHKAVIISEPIVVRKLPKGKRDPLTNTSPYKYSQYKKSYNVDYLYILDLYDIGFVRNYSAYIPSGAPYARVAGKIYIVDTSENKYTWYQPFIVTKSAEGEWKEGPDYPGLTNAFYQALEQAKEKALTPIKDAEI